MINAILGKLGYKISKINKVRYPADFNTAHRETIQTVREFTMTSPERIFSLIEAVKYLEKNNIQGDIVECGVWRGGSVMTIIKTLLEYNNISRNIYLYDTFEGMSEPTENDVAVFGESAKELLENDENKERNLIWCYAGIDDVKNNVSQFKYPSDKIHFVKGKIEDTIPETLPGKIALLRLDTDWYESTKHELEYLYPLLVNNGVLIIDDYGHWEGAKKAVDEYFAKLPVNPYLSRIDETGRVMIKHS